jgi:Mrp family chromosome partitioning ATPase
MILLGAMAASGFAGFCGAFGREFFDKRLRSADQFHEMFKIRRVVTVPWPKHYSPAADVDKNVLAFWRSTAANTAIRRIKAAVDRHTSGVHPRVVTFVSPRQRDGRSTLSRAFTEVLVKAGERTLLIDGDSIRAGLTKALMRDRQVAKIQLLGGGSGRAMRPFSADGFDFFPAGRTSGVDDLLACLKSRDAMARLGEVYDYVLIDLPPMLESGETAAIMAVASSCVLVAHSDCSSRDDVARGLELSFLDPEQVTTVALISSTTQH